MCRRASWRQMQKNIKRNPLRGREKIYWSLEKNDLHVWILFGFCPTPPTKKLKEMEEKYQPHPCSAQTGGTQDINWDLFFPSTHFFSDDKPGCPMSNVGLCHHCSNHCNVSTLQDYVHSFKVFVKAITCSSLLSELIARRWYYLKSMPTHPIPTYSSTTHQKKNQELKQKDRKRERQGVSSRSFDLLNSMIYWSRWSVD